MIPLITTPPHNIPYLFAAFAITWAVFFLYLFLTARRQAELREELEEIRRSARDKNGGLEG